MPISVFQLTCLLDLGGAVDCVLLRAEVGLLHGCADGRPCVAVVTVFLHLDRCFLKRKKAKFIYICSRFLPRYPFTSDYIGQCHHLNGHLTICKNKCFCSNENNFIYLVFVLCFSFAPFSCEKRRQKIFRMVAV